MNYDGYGRMKTRRYPVEDPGTHTTWDLLHGRLGAEDHDPRGATTNFASIGEAGRSISYTSRIRRNPGGAVGKFTYDAVATGSRWTTVPVWGTIRIMNVAAHSETRQFDAWRATVTASVTSYAGGGCNQSPTRRFRPSITPTIKRQA